MGLIEFIVLAVVLGTVVWLIQTYTPLPQAIKTIILVAVILVLILILVRSFVGDVQLPRLR